MDKEIVVRLHSSFEEMVRKFPDMETGFLCARDLQMLLGYAKWENFAKVIDKTITSCENAGFNRRTIFLVSGKWSISVPGSSAKSRTSP